MKFLPLITLISFANNVFGCIGCMEVSYHGTVQQDPKRLHYVSCACPCMDIIEGGLCRICGHYGRANRAKFAEEAEQAIDLFHHL